MSLIEVKIKHGRTFEDAKTQLARAVDELKSRFGVMVQKVEWSPSGDSVIASGPGVKLDLRVDLDEVHVKGDIPFLAGLLGPSGNLKSIVERAFQKSIKS